MLYWSYFTFDSLKFPVDASTLSNSLYQWESGELLVLDKFYKSASEVAKWVIDQKVSLIVLILVSSNDLEVVWFNICSRESIVGLDFQS